MEWIVPMAATLVGQPEERTGWICEEKYDGIRAVAYRSGRRVQLVSRSLREITGSFPELERAVSELPGGDLVLDGEIIALDEKSVSRFQLLQRRAAEGAGPARFAVFDCLERRGVSLLDEPLSKRRLALEQSVPEAADLVMRSQRLAGGALAAFQMARERGWEGIVLKDIASIYEPGVRSKSWLKVKCRREAEFVIGGFTAPAGKRRHLGALLVGLYDAGKLVFVGKVGTGFSSATLEELAGRLRGLQTERSPFSKSPKMGPKMGVAWVRPKLVAQLAYAEWTRDGKLRQPAFLGLREDKSPLECTWDRREP